MKLRANKQTLLAFKKNLQFLLKARELLEYKRELLINRIRSISVQADQERLRVNSELMKAFQFLITSYMVMGKNKIKSISQGSTPHFKIEIREFSYMGVVTPEINYVPEKEILPDYGLLHTSIELDQTILKLQNVLNSILSLASIETSIQRLIVELNKVQRRINALEKIFIPEYETSINKIAFILEEKERSYISLIKVLKQRFSERS
ncbi:MAG: V-type ATP synthase subunit D [Candidatus Helarchaeota archaeon]